MSRFFRRGGMHSKVLSGLAVAVSIAISGVSAARAATNDLGFALDASGSISSSSWTLETNGLAQALANNIPFAGGTGAHADNGNVYVISVVEFATTAGTP